MTALEHLTTAGSALRRNLLRSILTTLGIIIGVGSVIVMAAIGTGARQQIADHIANLGSNMLVVSRGATRSAARSAGAETAPHFTEADLRAVRELAPLVAVASGRLSGTATAILGNLNWATTVYGTHSEYPEIRDWKLAEGRMYSPREVTGGRKLAVLGATVAQELFAGGPAAGAQIRINNVPFEVSGVLTRKGESSFGRDQDDIILIPISTARSRVIARDSPVPDRVGSIYVKVAGSQDLGEAERQIKELLRVRRRIRPGQADDFRVRNLADIIQTRTATQQTMGLLLGATAAISLIVGGIGIMNIMLVSVTERTREIGLRMAVGAKRSDILAQFLIEAVLLCLLGGGIGVAIGMGATYGVSLIGDWPVLVNPAMIALALAAAAGVGVLFGFFPARRASRLDPITALRHE